MDERDGQEMRPWHGFSDYVFHSEQNRKPLEGSDQTYFFKDHSTGCMKGKVGGCWERRSRGQEERHTAQPALRGRTCLLLETVQAVGSLQVQCPPGLPSPVAEHRKVFLPNVGPR